MLLRRALQQRSAVEATPEAGVRITWSRPAGTGTVAIRSIELTPEGDRGPLPEAVLPYLAIVATGDAWMDTNAAGETVIRTFLDEFTLTATAELLARRLVAVQGPHNRVRLTLSGCLGLTAAAHRTWAEGSASGCSCGYTRGTADPHAARRDARDHLRERTAALVGRLGPAFTAAVALSR